MGNATGAVPAALPRFAGVRYSAWVALCLAVVAVSGLIAYCKIFSVFAFWDDEGGLMLAVKHFLDGHPLYEDVYAHHGPLYFLANWLVFRPAGLPVSHDAFRIATACTWVATCLLGALFVYRMTRNAVLAVLVHLVLLSHLGALVYEPGHPQGLVCVFSALAVVVSSFYAPARRTAVCLALGAIAAALLLTKVNVGGFVSVALALSLLVPGKPGRLTLALRVLVATAALLLPVALTRAHLHSPGAANYVLPACLSLVPILLLGWGHELPAAFRWKDYVAAALAGAATGLLVCALVRWHGTSAYGILYGVVLQHSTFAVTFGSLPDLGLRALAWACGSVCLSLLYLWARRHDGRLAGSVRSGVSWVKLAFGASVLYYSYRFRGNHEALLAFLTFGTPLLWLGLTPDPGKAAPGQFYPRLVLVSLAALETLQTYPVFGNQMAVGTFLMDLVAALCVHDVLAGAGALPALPRDAADGRPGLWLPRPLRNAGGLRRVGGGLVVALILALIARDALRSYRIYSSQMPLGLPGAARLRLTEEQVATYNWLVSNLRASSDTFISAPEIDSFYFWTGIGPPTRLNANCWMTFFTDAQQRAVADEFARYPRRCVVRYRPGIEMYYQMDSRADVVRDHETRPLMDYINKGFKTIGRVGDYEFLVPRTRDVELVYCARLSDRPDGGSPPSEAALSAPGKGSGRDRAAATTVATLTLPPMAGRTAHEVIIYDVSRGVVIEKAVLEADIDLDRPRRLDVPVSRAVTVGPQSFTVARLLDPRGRVIASVPFLR
jgi:hypothetical protein